MTELQAQEVIDNLSTIIEQLDLVVQGSMAGYYAVVVIVPLILIILALNWFFKQFLDRQN